MVGGRSAAELSKWIHFVRVSRRHNRVSEDLVGAREGGISIRQRFCDGLTQKNNAMVNFLKEKLS